MLRPWARAEELAQLTQCVLLSGYNAFLMRLTKGVTMWGVDKLGLPRVLHSLQGNQSDSAGNYAPLRADDGQQVLTQLALVQTKRASTESLLPLIRGYFAKAANNETALPFFLQDLGPAPGTTLLESLIEADCWVCVACVASRLPSGEFCHGRVIVTREDRNFRVEIKDRKGYYHDRSGIYVGEIRDGKPHGWGRKLFSSGSVYEGEWKNGERRGYGEFSHGGMLEKGIFENERCVRKIKYKKAFVDLLPGLRAPHSAKIKLI
jgi:hypothetical protein